MLECIASVPERVCKSSEKDTRLISLYICKVRFNIIYLYFLTEKTNGHITEFFDRYNFDLNCQYFPFFKYIFFYLKRYFGYK